MATIKVKHLVRMNGAAGALPRYFWQPSATLRKLGFAGQRVPLDWQRFDDGSALELAAIARVRELNEDAAARQFARAMATLATPTPLPVSRTLGALMAAYRASGDFTSKAAATQRSYRQAMDKLETWAGDIPVRIIDAARVQRLLEAFKATPAFANAIVRVLRLILEYGRREGWLSINPALRPGLTGSLPSGLIWPRGAIDVFVAAADAKGLHSIGTAVLINEWLGQREGDVLRLGASALRGGTLWVRQQKTGAGVALPIDMVPHLVQRVAEEAARVAVLKAKLKPGEPIPATILVCERTKRPWKLDHFRHAFAEVRAAAAKVQAEFEIDHLMPGRDPADPTAFVVKMTDLTFMQLRHTAVTRLGEAEVDQSLISTITGHSLATVGTILERYMVRTGKMARLAFGRRATAEGKGVVVTARGGTRGEGQL